MRRPAAGSALWAGATPLCTSGRCSGMGGGWGTVAALSLALATLRLCDPEDVTEAFPAQAPH